MKRTLIRAYFRSVPSITPVTEVPVYDLLRTNHKLQSPATRNLKVSLS